MENNNKEESREFYVYKHIRKDNNTCFYVGKGKGGRIYKPKRNKHYNRIRKKYGCYVVKIKENLTEKEAFALEREIIEDYVFVFGYGINIDGYRDYSDKKYLTNCTWGGEGVSGMHHSEETKQIISEKNKCKHAGEKNEMWGKHHSEEAKMKMSEKAKGKHAGEKNGMWGKHHSEEAKMKMSEKAKGRNPYACKTPEEMKIIANKKREKLSKKVICITTGKAFDSITEASNWYNVARNTISFCCKGKRNYAGKLNGIKLQWKYSEEDDDNESKAV